MIIKNVVEVLSELERNRGWDIGDLHKLNPEWRAHLEFCNSDSLFLKTNNQCKPIFLVRPQRLSNQCIQDYFMMIAEANYLESILDVCEAMNIHFNVAVLLSEFRFEQLLRGELLPKPEAFFKKIERHPDLFARICSICLHQGFGVSDIKNYAFSFICEIHKVMLVDECPACRDRLMYTRKRRYFCNCDYDLRACQVRYIEPWIERFYRLFAPWRLNASERDFNVIIQRSDAVSYHMYRLLMGHTSLSGRLSSREYKRAAYMVEQIEKVKYPYDIYKNLGILFKLCSRQILLPWISSSYHETDLSHLQKTTVSVTTCAFFTQPV